MRSSRAPRRALRSLAVLPLVVAAVACAPQEGEDPDAAPTTGDCAVDQLPLKTAGKLTIGTDSPAYEPWFAENDPTNGQGYESAVAYAVAEELGFDRADVTWVRVPFNNSYKPGEKNFDFDINQISISEKRAKAVDFSRGYYSASQAVIALEKDGVEATSVADLASLKLGAQTGTTSLTAITDVIQPSEDPLVFDDTNAAKQALLNGQVEAIVADLPTAFYITGAEIEGSEIVGQFQPETGESEEFGLLFEKGSDLVGCVDEALHRLEEDGSLDRFADEWIATNADVPVLD